MLENAVKILLTSVLVVAISEIAKRSRLAGAIIASVPLTSVLAMIWLYAETQDSEKIAELSWSILWLVLPSLVLFVVLPILLRAGWSFWPSLGVSIGLTAAAYFAMLAIMSRSGFSL